MRGAGILLDHFPSLTTFGANCRFSPERYHV